MSYLASGADGGNNAVHVSPVGALCCGSVPALCGSSGPADKKVRLRTGQLCLGSYFSVTEGADQEPPPPKKIPSLQTHPFTVARAQETPPGLPRPHPNLGTGAAVCASRFQGRPRASPPPPPAINPPNPTSTPLLLSRELPSATWHGGSARCLVCVCVLVQYACVCSHPRVYLWLGAAVYACAFVSVLFE